MHETAAWLDQAARQYGLMVYRTALAGAITLLAGLLVWQPLYGWQDFWAHAAVGRWAWDHGEVPRQTLFLWTAEIPWVYHHWLAEVIFYGLTCCGGPETFPRVVLAVTVTLAVMPFFLAWGYWLRQGNGSSFIALPIVLTIMAIAIRFQPRPELFTEVCLALLLLFLASWRRPGIISSELSRGDKIRCGAVLLLFTAWANLHGGVVIGLLMLGLTAVGDLMQDGRNVRTRTLAITTLLAFLAACVNPYGLAYWQSLQAVGTYAFQQLPEWLPAWRTPPMPVEMAVLAAGLGGLALVTWLLTPDRRLAQLGWLLLTAALFLRARRNIWPFSVTCLMMMAANARTLEVGVLRLRLSRWLGPPQAHPRRPAVVLSRWLVRLAFLGWVVMQCLVHTVEFKPWRPLYPGRLEEGLVDFVSRYGLEGRVFNDYENSSFMQWSWSGHPPLYVDLLNAYPDEVIKDYQDIAFLSKRGRKLLDEQGIEIVVLTTSRGTIASLVDLANYLDRRAAWVRVYAGADGVVWVRRNQKYAALWQPLWRTVPLVPFGALEYYGSEDMDLTPSVPGIPSDFGKTENDLREE